MGGEDRIDPTIFDKVGDSLIANFGKEEWRDVRAFFCRRDTDGILSTGPTLENNRTKGSWKLAHVRIHMHRHLPDSTTELLQRR